MLHNALLALAASFSDDPAIKNIEIRDLFARQAKALLEGLYCSIWELDKCLLILMSRGDGTTEHRRRPSPFSSRKLPLVQRRS